MLHTGTQSNPLYYTVTHNYFATHTYVPRVVYCCGLHLTTCNCVCQGHECVVPRTETQRNTQNPLQHTRRVMHCFHPTQTTCHYTCQCGVATVSRIDKIIGLFCRMLSLLQDSFAKQTYHLIDPTNRSHNRTQTIHVTHWEIQSSGFHGNPQ